MSKIELSSITKMFGPVCAVQDVSFRVAEGAFVSILGPSGCGKTTLLRMIAGFEAPTAGEIRIENLPVSHLPPWKRNVGMVFQSYALFPFMTVFDNIAFGLRMRGLNRAETAKKIEDVLKVVGLSGLEERYPRQLSGGQAQRVALARAIVYRPEVLLLDEPISNLDARLRDEMRFELQRIQSETGVTTLFVTHDQSEALAISDSIIVMNNSVVRQIGSPEEIWAAPRTRFVADFVGVENIFDGTLAEAGGIRGFRVGAFDGEAPVLPCPAEHGAVTAVGIRGRDIRIVDRELDGHVTVPGRVLGTNYLGHERAYEVETRFGEKPLTVVLESMRAIGETVLLGLPHDKFLWLTDD